MSGAMGPLVWNHRNRHGISPCWSTSIWVFPKIGVVFPPNHPILIGFSIINHPFWGYPYFWKHPYFPLWWLISIWCLKIFSPKVGETGAILDEDVSKWLFFFIPPLSYGRIVRYVCRWKDPNVGNHSFSGEDFDLMWNQGPWEFCLSLVIPPETNIAPENRVSQKEIHLPTINLQFQGGYCFYFFFPGGHLWMHEPWCILY